MKERQGVKTITPRKTTNRYGNGNIRITYDGKLFIGRRLKVRLNLNDEGSQGLVMMSNPETNTLYLDFDYGDVEEEQISWMRIDKKQYGGLVVSCKNHLIESGIKSIERLLLQERGNIVKSSIIIENPVVSTDGEKVVEIEVPDW